MRKDAKKSSASYLAARLLKFSQIVFELGLVNAFLQLVFFRPITKLRTLRVGNK